MEGYSLPVREGFRNFLRVRTLSFAMIGCIAVAVFAIGAFGLLSFNINFLLDKWERRVELVAFLPHELKEPEAQTVLKNILAVPQVGEARLLTGRQSWEELFAEVSGSIDLKEVFLDEVLPASIVIKPAPGRRDIAAIRQVASRVASLDNVEEVKFEETLLKRYMQLRRELAVFATATSVFWMLVFGLITINIARLSSAARQNEIHTLRMLGASKKFIRRALTVEGVAQGIFGSAVAVAVLAGTAGLLEKRMGGTLQMPLRLFAAAFLAGPVLGLLASWFSFRRSLALAIAIVLLLSPVGAQAEKSLDSEIARYKQELAGLKNELDESRATAEKITRRETAVIDELHGLEKRLDSLSSEIKAGEKNLADNKGAVEKAKIELDRCEVELGQSRKELGQWLRLLCNRREPTMVEVILRDMPHSQITRRREIVTRLVEKEAESFERTKRLQTASARRREDLSKRLELDTLHAEAARLRAEESIKKKKKREALLERLRDQKNMYMAVIKDLEASSTRLRELIETQPGKSRGVFAGSAPFREMKGLLPWPADGEITVPFGRIKNPGSSTYTRHRGLDFSAPEGAVITAVHDAAVIYCDWFRGYGKLVILDHGDGYSSVYAHCLDILVSKGDLVRAGQPIASVGETGSLKGPFLYFELREHGQPVDPALWLQRRNLNETR